MKQNLLRTSITLLTLAGALAYAQRHQPPDPAEMVQHRVNFLTEKLNLSSAQQQQATTIFTNAATNEKPSHDQMKAAHESLHSAITKNDSAGIDQAANSIANLMAQSISAHAKAEAAFYQTLTPDQQAKYSQLRHHGPGMHGFGFHQGGPGSPGGPPSF
jgi:Spy/CpxP family protein refolding chaperone